jgi:DUF2934 family protein
MAGKTSGTSRKAENGKKPRTKQAKTTPILREDGAGRESAQVTQIYPELEEQIRRRAYELYEERGRQEGFHEEDWIRAEEEVRLRYQREKSA